MVTTTAGTVSDHSSNKENRESQNKDDLKNEHSIKTNSVDNSKSVPEEKLSAIGDGTNSTMSVNQIAGGEEATQNSDTATSNTRSNLEGSSNGYPDSSTSISNGPVDAFANTPQTNYQPFVNATSLGEQTGTTVNPNAQTFAPPQFSKTQQSSTTPTLNKLLMSPSRYPPNYMNTSNSSASNLQPRSNQRQIQSWDHRTSQETNTGTGERAKFDPTKEASSATFDPSQQPDPSYNLSAQQNQLRYPPPSNKHVPYGQPQQYNSPVPTPPPASSGYFQNYPTPTPARYPNYSTYPNYNNQQQQQQQPRYFSRHQVPPPSSQDMDPQHGVVKAPQSQDPFYQQPREHMMSPNRRTPQSTAVPSPMSAAPSPHMLPRTPASQLRGPSPAPASPAFMGQFGGSLGSPLPVRPGTPHQQTHSVRSSDVVDNDVVPSPSQMASGYPPGYRPTASQSPYSSQPPNYPQPGVLSPQQQSVPYQSGQINNTILPSPTAAPSAIPPQAGHGSAAPGYNQSAQQPPNYQQPGYSSSVQADKRSIGQSSSPAPDNRRGAAAAAAAAMVAAAHSAQPGHVPGPRSAAPSYQPQTGPIPQARPQNPNFSHMQSGNENYPSPRPYSQMPPPRMPLSSHPHRVPGQPGVPPQPPTQNSYRMHAPGSAPPPPGYRHPSMPPSASGSHPGYYPNDPNYPHPTPHSDLQRPPRPTENRSYEEPTKKQPTLKSASQKLAALFEPADEPGRREFVEAILRYWEEKEVPLKNAPLMGRKTVDLFRLYHIVKDRGGMQEVTSSKTWPEISSILGLGTTTSSGFTLKKQYCKYLYGYECRMERGQPEPQEALTRVTEANRKRKQAIENAEEKARMASMPPMHSSPMMGHPRQPSPYPPQGYPPNHYQQMGQQYPTQPLTGPIPPNHMSPRTAIPPNSSYAPPPNYSGSTAHRTRALPPHPYSNSQQGIPPSTAAWQQPPHQVPNSSFSTPASSAPPQFHMRPNHPQPQFMVGASNASEQVIRNALPSTRLHNSQTMPLLPNNSPSISLSSSIPMPIPTPQAPNIGANATPPSAAPTPEIPPNPYPYPYDSYSASQQVRTPKLSPAQSPAPRPGSVPYSSIPSSYPRSSVPLRTLLTPSQSMASLTPPQANTNQTSTMTGGIPPPISLGMKRPGPGLGPIGPPNKVFRPDPPHVTGSPQYRPDSGPIRSRYPNPNMSHIPYPGTNTNHAARGAPNPMRVLSSHPQNYNSYRKDKFSPRFADPRSSLRWIRPGVPPHRQMYRRGVMKSNYGRSSSSMTQQFKRQYMYFPPNSVEATPLRMTGFRRKTCNDVGLVDGWRLIMALKSGLLVESTWAINILNILLYDQQSVAQIRLSQLPGLLDALTEHYIRYLSEIFTLPDELRALGISEKEKSEELKGVDSEDRETVSIIHKLRKLKKKSCVTSGRLNGKLVKFRVKVQARSNPYLVDKSADWDNFHQNKFFDDLSYIVSSLTHQKKRKRNKSFFKSNESKTPAMEATLEDILSIPFSLLPPDVEDTSSTNIREKDVFDTKDSTTGADPCSDELSNNNDHTKNVKQENNLLEQSDCIKKEAKSENEVTATNSDMEVDSSFKSDPNCAKESDQDENKDITKSEFVSEKMSKVDTSDTHPVTNGMDEPIQNGIKDSDSIESCNENPASPLKKNKSVQLEKDLLDSLKPAVTVNGLHEIKSSFAPTSEVAVKTSLSSKVKTEKLEVTEMEVDNSLKTTNEDKSRSHSLVDMEKIECKKEATDDVKEEKFINPPMPRIFKRVKKLLEDRKVVMLEDEAFGRDGSMEDPISGPLLKSKACQSREELLNRIRSVSNILYNLTFIPANIDDFCRHRALLKAISGILLLRHKHKVRNRKLNFEVVDNSRDTDDHHKKGPDNKTPDITNQKQSENENPIKRETVSSETNLSEVLAPTFDFDSKERLKDLSLSSTVLNGESDNQSDVYQDSWWWDVVQKLREDALVIVSNLASVLNLSQFSEDHVPLAIIDACLHWCLCPSSDACDFYKTNPRHHISAQRLSLEILTKLSIKEDNVDLILATRPHSRIEKLFKFLINLISDRRDQTLREFAIVLLSNLAQSDPDAARTIGFLTGSVSCMVAFLEACEETARHNQQLFRQPSNVIHCGTTPFMMVKAAKALHAIVMIPENRHKFITFQLRLFSLSMSEFLGRHVTAIMSSLLYELGNDSSDSSGVEIN